MAKLGKTMTRQQNLHEAACDKLYETLANALGASRIKRNEPVAKYCNWKVGGPAELFLQVQTTAELAQAVRLAQQEKTPCTILGFGANTIVADRGIDGLVILNRAERMIFHADHLVEADSGSNLALLARRAGRQGIAGLEFLIGIPGTVGGAVYGNAGTREQWISTILESCHLLNRHGEERCVQGEDLEFRYRHSRLKHTKEIVLTARLRGRSGEPSQIERRMTELLRLRDNQPGGSSAGSVFRNPDGDFAGRLIEAAGLKGLRAGDAIISDMHANFIVNKGRATAADIKTLIDRAKHEVKARFGVALHEEIQYVGAWDRSDS